MNTPENNPDKAAKVFADDRANVFHSWSAQAQISPMAIAGGAGSYFWDFTGKKYLDFSCQLVFTNIGHQHPKVIAAIKEQADILTTIAPQHANEARNEAAQRIVELAGDTFAKVFFTNAGADAVENATGIRPALPARVAQLFDREERFDVLPGEYDAVRDYVLARATR